MALLSEGKGSLSGGQGWGSEKEDWSWENVGVQSSPPERTVEGEGTSQWRSLISAPARR